MLHWSQEASTGWTRNSWFGSIAKVGDVPFCAFAPWGPGHAPTGRDRHRESTIRVVTGAKEDPPARARFDLRLSRSYAAENDRPVASRTSSRPRRTPERDRE